MGRKAWREELKEDQKAGGLCLRGRLGLLCLRLGPELENRGVKVNAEKPRGWIAPSRPHPTARASRIWQPSLLP